MVYCGESRRYSGRVEVFDSGTLEMALEEWVQVPAPAQRGVSTRLHPIDHLNDGGMRMTGYREEPDETDHDSLCPLNEDSPDYDIDGYCQCHEIREAMREYAAELREDR